MSIVRTIKRESPFVQLDKDFIGNGTLSLKATGLLTYILSRPDGWQIRMKDIQNRFNDGETSVRSAMKELMTMGYVNRYRERCEGGKFGDWIYDVYERPEFNVSFKPKSENHVLEPKRDFPELDNPEQENPELDNRGFSNNDFSNNDFNNKEEEEEEEEIQLNSLLDLFKELLGFSNETVKQKIKSWLEMLPYEVIKNEIEYSSLNGAESWNYIEKALIEDKDLNIDNLQGLEVKRNNHAAKKKKNVRKGSNNSYKKNTRKENDPDGIFKRYEDEANKNKDEATIQRKKQELEDTLKKLRAN